MIITIREEKYAVAFVPMENHDGFALYNPNVIMLDPTLKNKELLESAIHEWEHEWDDDLKEDVVAMKGAQLAEYLDMLGFKHVPPGYEVRKAGVSHESEADSAGEAQ